MSRNSSRTSPRIRARIRAAAPLAAVLVAGLALAGCSGSAAADGTDTATAPDGTAYSATRLQVDFATYNPLSLVIKDQGWLEATLGDAVEVAWSQSTGGPSVNDGLRGGTLDVGSTAGSSSLLTRANGFPAKLVGIYNQPEWSAIVVGADSPIQTVEDLRGKSIAATKGTDPYLVLVQALEAHGVGLDEVQIENLPHAGGRIALENGAVDAWAGLDPMMADSELNAGSRLIYRNIDFHTYGALLTTEKFAAEHGDLLQLVLDAYEKARLWAADHAEEVIALLAETSGIDTEIARKVYEERTNVALSAVPDEDRLTVLTTVGRIYVESGDISSVDDVDRAFASLVDPSFAENADPSRIAG